MFPTDDYYGHRAILARYTGHPGSLPIWAHLQHGWNPRAGFGTKYVEELGNRATLSPRLPALVWSERNARHATEAGLTEVEIVGSPYAYLDRLLGPTTRPDGVGTLVYPSHTGSGTAARRADEEYIDILREREAGPVTVCLYWRDHDDGEIRQAYERAGFAVISHGRREDPLFLFRQREALLAHRRVVTNRVGSAIWYGAFLGREIEIYGPVFGPRSTEEERWWDELHRTEWPDLLAGPLDGAEAEVRARDELGADHLRSPAELAELLGWTGWRRVAAPAVRRGVGAWRRLRPG